MIATYILTAIALVVLILFVPMDEPEKAPRLVDLLKFLVALLLVLLAILASSPPGQETIERRIGRDQAIGKAMIEAMK